MPRSADGNYSLPENSLVSNGQEVLPPQHNTPLSDLANEITSSLSRDGRGGMRNDLAMNGFRVTGLAAGVNPNDAATMSQVQGATGLPVGFGGLWFTNTAPVGYLICAGQSLSRTQYPGLFTVLGTLYGAPSGSTFRLPDLRGRVGVGLDVLTDGSFSDRLTSVDSRTIAASGGAQEVTLTEAQMPEHDHTASIAESGEHTHPFFGSRAFDEPPVNQWRGDFGTGNNQNTVRNTGMQAAGRHSHNATISKKGGGQAHNNVQPTLIINYIVKAF